MSTRKKRDQDFLKFRPGRDLHHLDHLVAEKDAELDSYYHDEARYVNRALDRDDPAIFYIGPKGAAKSAILQMIRLRNKSGRARIIDVAPDQIAITPLANADLSSPLLSDPGKYRWLFRSLWDFILSVEILQHEYPDENALLGAIKNLVRSSDEKRARSLLNLSGKREGAKQSLADRVLDLVRAVEVSGTTPVGDMAIKVEFQDREPKKDHDDARSLLMLVNQVAREIPKLVEHDYYILVDDLDYQWGNTPLQNAFISSLFSSLAKLNGSRQLKFVVALRKRIYRNLRLEDKDKYRQWICDVEWEYEAVKQIAQRRLNDVLNCSEKDIWNGAFPQESFKMIYAATSGVPREVIRLSAICVKTAKRAGHSSVSNGDIDSAIIEFSEEKLEDIASDWNYVYPGLDSLMKRLRGTHKDMPFEKLREFAYQVGLEVQEGRAESYSYAWVGGLWEDPQELAAVLINCGLMYMKEHREARPDLHEFIERDAISERNWFRVSPVVAPGLRMLGT